MSKIIAELCQNHNGDIVILKEMVWAAAEAGADYAKIQTIFSEDLTCRERFENGKTKGEKVEIIKRPYKAEYDRLKTLEIGYELYESIINECTKAKIEPLTTIFSHNRISEVKKFGFKDMKVASYDCASFPFLSELKNNFNHLFISTGATFDDEIRRASKILEGKDFSFLHCVTIYPTPLSYLNLNRMNFLRQFTKTVGLSEHTLTKRDSIKASAVGIWQGADVIERHFTILPENQTKDGPVSISPLQLKKLCDLRTNRDMLKDYIDNEVGDFSEMLGNETRNLTEVELLNRDYYRGRFAENKNDGTIIYNWEKNKKR
jgi:N,N'-diacetyllegionaminate synthase